MRRTEQNALHIRHAKRSCGTLIKLSCTSYSICTLRLDWYKISILLRRLTFHNVQRVVQQRFRHQTTDWNLSPESAYAIIWHELLNRWPWYGKSHYHIPASTIAPMRGCLASDQFSIRKIYSLGAHGTGWWLENDHSCSRCLRLQPLTRQTCAPSILQLDYEPVCRVYIGQFDDSPYGLDCVGWN